MNRILALISSIILIAILMALVWAAQTHQETVSDLPGILARDIQPLLNGTRIVDINLGTLEQRIEELRSQYPYIRDIIIQMPDADGVERTVYPFTYDLENPGEFPDPLRYHDVGIPSETGVITTLYFEIDAQRSRFFNAAIAGIIVALLTLAGLGVYRVRSQEEEVRKTTTLLEEKQRELTRLERLALVGQITANLLHDLKKPVLNIRAEAESLAESETRSIIHEETELFLSLVRDLQLERFVKDDQELAEFVDVGDVLMRSLRLVRYAQKNVEVHFNLPEGLPFILGQRHQLIQVFSNLFLNAFQALQGDGSIHVFGIEVTDEDGHGLEISITDDGPGIPFEILNHIFEPFYSTQPSSDSTGLGLYITRSLVESMGGTITAQSIPKHGTTFTIRFPLSDEERSGEASG